MESEQPTQNKEVSQAPTEIENLVIVSDAATGEDNGSKKRKRATSDTQKENSVATHQPQPPMVRAHHSPPCLPTVSVKELKEDDEGREFSIRVPKKDRFIQGDLKYFAEKSGQSLIPLEELSDLSRMDVGYIGQQFVESMMSFVTSSFSTKVLRFNIYCLLVIFVFYKTLLLLQ